MKELLLPLFSMKYLERTVKNLYVFLTLLSWKACTWRVACQKPVLLKTLPKEKMGGGWRLTYVFLLVFAWLEENKLLSSQPFRDAKNIYHL